MNQTIRSNHYFLFIFIYFLVIPLILTPFLIIFIPSSWDDANISVVQQVLMFLPLVLLYPILTKTPVHKCFALHRIHPVDALLSICIALLFQPFMALIVFLTSYLQPNLAEQAMVNFQRSGGFFVPLVALAVLPAVFEEMIFRGIALHSYSHLGRKKAILISAFFFALLHMNLQQAAYAFVLGSVFAFFVQRTGSIFSSLLPHFCINALSWCMIYFGKSEAQAVEELSAGMTLLGLGINCLFAIPFLVGLLYLFMKRTSAQASTQQNNIYSETESSRFFTPSVICIILLFLLFGVLPTIYH